MAGLDGMGGNNPLGLSSVVFQYFQLKHDLGSTPTEIEEMMVLRETKSFFFIGQLQFSGLVSGDW